MHVQVHVEQLPVESFVDLLLPLHPTGLLHGPLQALPVQVTGQVTQENSHMLRVVQGDAQLARKRAGAEEEKQRKEVEKKVGKEAGLQRKEGWGVND